MYYLFFSSVGYIIIAGGPVHVKHYLSLESTGVYFSISVHLMTFIGLTRMCL